MEDVRCKLPGVWPRRAYVILDTLAYMDGWTYVRTVANDVVAKTKISRIDGLQYFLNYGAQRARFRRAAKLR